MTDRHAGYVVTLDRSIRADDAERLIELLLQIKGVISVTPVLDDQAMAVAQARATRVIREKLLELIDKNFLGI